MRVAAAAAVAVLALLAILCCTGAQAAQGSRSHPDAALQPSASALASESQAAREAEARRPRPPFLRPGEAPPTELSTMLGSSINAIAQLELPSLRLDVYTQMRLLGETVSATQALVNAETTPWHWHLDLLRGQCLKAAEQQEKDYQKAKRDLTADAQRRSARAAQNPADKGVADLSWSMVKAHVDQFLSGKPMVKYLREHWQHMAQRQRVQVLQSETVHPGQSTNGQQFASQRITYVLDDRGRVTRLSGYVSPLPNRYSRGGGFGGAVSASPLGAASPIANKPASASNLGASASAGSIGGGIGGGQWNYPANGIVVPPARLPDSPARQWPTLYSQALNVVASDEYRRWNETLWSHPEDSTPAALAGDFGVGYFFPLEFGGSREEPLNLFPQREYTRKEGRWDHAIEWTQELRGYISGEHEAPTEGCLRLDLALRYNSSDDRAVIPLGGWFNVSVAESCLFRRYDWKGTSGEQPSAGGMRTISFNWTQDERAGSEDPVVLPKLVEPYTPIFGNGFVPQTAMQIPPLPSPSLPAASGMRFAAAAAKGADSSSLTPAAPRSLSRAQKRKLDKAHGRK